MDKIVTARKEHQCVYCERTIRKGKKHQFGKTRAPRYAKDDLACDFQIGIEYAEWRLCLKGDPLCKEPKQ